MYPIHADSIACIIFVLWSQKYKVGHIDLILIKDKNLLNLPEIPEFSYVSHTPPIEKHVLMHSGHSN